MASEVGSGSENAGFEVFTRPRWAALARPLVDNSSAEVVRQLTAGTREPIPVKEVVDIFLPLTEFLILLAELRNSARQKIGDFLGEDRESVPFIVGIAGGVAVGKSTTARILQKLLRRGGEQRSVEVLTTDNFLFSNAVLEERGILNRKGFPESYDKHRLTQTLTAIRTGKPDVATPVYSHLSYDIVPDNLHIVRRPDILLVEGLNVLQGASWDDSPSHVVPSDFFDVSIYVDAAETDVAEWFRERLLALRSVPNDPGSFFHRFSSLSDDEFAALTDHVWTQVNLINLRENIAPTRARAHIILEKGRDHLVERVLLRRI